MDHHEWRRVAAERGYYPQKALHEPPSEADDDAACPCPEAPTEDITASCSQLGGFSGRQTAPRQLQKLIRLAAGNPYKNAYHHPWHSMSVVIHAALLADLARCDAPSRDQLLLAALCHDLDHRGKRVSRVPFVEERRAAVLAIRTSFGQGRGRDARALIAQIEATATAFDADQPMDEVTALLRDADIMASVFHPRNFALELTRGVMTEKGMAVTAHDGLTGFLKIMMQRGLSHAVTRHLATTMPSRLLGLVITLRRQHISASDKGGGHEDIL